MDLDRVAMIQRLGYVMVIAWPAANLAPIAAHVGGVRKRLILLSRYAPHDKHDRYEQRPANASELHP
jgi:hypothetical protein